MENSVINVTVKRRWYAMIGCLHATIYLASEVYSTTKRAASSAFK